MTEIFGDKFYLAPATEKDKHWQALQAFYHLKSLLLPSFMEKNKRNLGSIEAELIRQYEKGGVEK